MSEAPVILSRAMATERRVLTVNELIDERPPSAFQITTIVLCAFVILFDGFDTQAMGFLVPSIAAEFGVPARRIWAGAVGGTLRPDDRRDGVRADRGSLGTQVRDHSVGARLRRDVAVDRARGAR